MSALALRAVTFHHGSHRALAGIDLTVESGEHVAIVGASGAGKSTLFRVLNLSLAPNAGVYQLDGSSTATLAGASLRRARSTIATIHQRQDLVMRLSVRDNVLAGRLGRWGALSATRAYFWPSKDMVAQVEATLERVGMGAYAHQRCDRLSGGQLQRVAIARALFQDARLVLADEPVASLDPRLAEEILALLVETAREGRRTLIVSLHQPDLAVRHFPRLVGLAGGRVTFDRRAADVTPALLAECWQEATA